MILREEIEAELSALAPLVEDLELKSLLNAADDHRDAILTINPGAGGTESQDWADMLVRMYTRWGNGTAIRCSSSSIRKETSQVSKVPRWPFVESTLTDI